MGRLVPWCTWEEWDEVASCLLSGDSRLIGRGIARVSTWRCRGRVPLGADATAALLEISQQDACWYHGDATGIVSEHSLRLAYSMALVRFVNGVVDSGQKGQVASSVATLARTYGLPRMLVDIRHEATHNSLPSLGTLRLASTHALQWLHVNYWNKQQEFRAESVERLDALVQQLLELHADGGGKADEQSEGGSSGTSARELKQQRKMAVAELKDIVPSGDTVLLVEPLLKRLPGSRPAAAKGSKKRPRSVAWFEQGGDPPSWLAAVQLLAKDWENLPALLLERLLRQSCEAFSAKDWAEAVKRTQLCSQLLEALMVQCSSAEAPSTRASEVLAEALLTALLTAMRGAVPAERTSSSGGGGNKRVKLPLTLSLEVDAAAARTLAGDGAQCRAVERFEELAQGITTLISTEPRRKSAQKLLGLTMELFSDDIDTEDLPSSSSSSLIAEAESAQQALMESIRERQASSSIKTTGVGIIQPKGVWAKHPSWSPCAVGCVPSTASQNGAPPSFIAPSDHDEAEAGHQEDIAVTVHHNYEAPSGAADGMLLYGGEEDPAAEGGDAYESEQVKNLALPFLIDATSAAAAAHQRAAAPDALEDIQASVGLL